MDYWDVCYSLGWDGGSDLQDYVALALRTARERASLPIREAAKFSGITLERLEMIEEGSGFPNSHELSHLACAYGEHWIDPFWVLAEASAKLKAARPPQQKRKQ